MQSARLFRNGNAIRIFRPFWDSSRSQKFGRSLVNQQNEGQSSESQDPYDGNYTFTECDQYTKVSVIGAAGRVGKTLSLLLKTCPLIDHLCLFDTDKAVKGVGVDISHIDTRCNVSYVCGMRNIQQALNAPDVVIIAAGCPATPSLNGKKLFEKNAPIIAGISEACARFCPKACIILITSPINSLLPVVGSVYEVITNKIPSRKMFGLTTLDVVRANTFVAEVVRKNPNSIIVPVIGGTSQDTLVPVISQMKPCHKIKRGETIALTECLKRAEENLMDCQNCGTRGASSLSTAYAGFRFTTSLVMALKGAENVIECAFVKSDIIPELEYLASPLKLGIRGIEYNFGYPPLSDYELAGLEQSAASLMTDIEMGKEFVHSIQDTIQRGLIWKQLSEDNVKTTELQKVDFPGRETTAKQAEKNRLRKRQMTDERWRKEKPKKEDEEEEEGAVEATALTQQVYTEGMRNWATQASFKQFFRTADVRENCNGIAGTNSISADLDSGTCGEDSSFHGEKDLDGFLQIPDDATTASSRGFPKAGFLRSNQTSALPGRGYHTMTRTENHRNGESEESKRFSSDTSQKMLVPLGRQRSSLDLLKMRRRPRKFPESQNLDQNQYKNLNAAAKQKYRSFNVQKKFTPSASVLLLLEQKKRRDLVTANTPKKKEEESKKVDKIKMEEECEEEEEESKDAEEKEKQESEPEPNEIDKRLVIQKDQDKCKDFILKQLQQLKRENEDLKKRLSKITDDKRLESALQTQSDHLELERTKLKACWLIMSSTMEAFNNFCRKFTFKTDEQIMKAAKDMEQREEQDEEESDEDGYDDALDMSDRKNEEKFEDARENLSKPEKEKKDLRYDEKYFKFLQKLMEDQMESQLDEKRSRARK